MADEVVSMVGPDRMSEEQWLVMLLRLMQTESYHRVRVHTLHLDIEAPPELTRSPDAGQD